MTPAEAALDSVARGDISYCRFLAAIDTDRGVSHQGGIYIAKEAGRRILFDIDADPDRDRERFARIEWQDGRITESRFIYYKSKDEYRITRFGRNFPWLTPDHTGSLFVLVRQSPDSYQAFVLDTDEEIEAFMQGAGIGPVETNRIIGSADIAPSIDDMIRRYVSGLAQFPSTAELAEKAREFAFAPRATGSSPEILRPDDALLCSIDVEYRIFRAIESHLYSGAIRNGFASVEEFVIFANSVLNRRKSRAGTSFELQLAGIFEKNRLAFTSQPRTENGKRPDFIFPSETAYHDQSFPTDRLVMLAAKTTCKERWRQILTEARRLQGRTIFLCTLQQGMSAMQIDQMSSANVALVVPRTYHATYPRDRRGQLWTLKGFVDHVRSAQNG